MEHLSLFYPFYSIFGAMCILVLTGALPNEPVQQDITSINNTGFTPMFAEFFGQGEGGSYGGEP